MSETVFVTLGGEQVNVIIEGGNMAAGASLALGDLNEAAARAETAAAEAEAAVAEIPALVADRALTSLGNVTTDVFSDKEFQPVDIGLAVAVARPDSVRAATLPTVQALDYGVIVGSPSAAAANTIIVQRILDGLGVRGGGVLDFPGGEIWLGQIEIKYSNVGISGIGGDTSHGAGSPFTSKTVLRYAGTAFLPFIRLCTPYGPTTQRRWGQSIEFLEISGESLAGIGVQIDSSAGGIADTVGVRHCVTSQWDLKCGVSGTDSPAGEALDVQLWSFTRCTFDQRTSAYTATPAFGFNLQASTNANVSGNYFTICNGIYTNGPGWNIPGADNNVFTKCSAFRAIGTSEVYTFDLGGATVGTNQGAYANLFLSPGWNPTYGFRFKASDPAAPLTVRNNMILKYDMANGGTAPVVGANSKMVVLDQNGKWTGIELGPVNIQQDGTGPDNGLKLTNGANRHDIYGNGSELIFAGNGFQAKYSMVGGLNLALGDLSVAGTSVVKTRKTGWSGGTGPARRNGFTTSTVTTAELAEVMKALLDDLFAHGLIGT